MHGSSILALCNVKLSTVAFDVAVCTNITYVSGAVIFAAAVIVCVEVAVGC